ncbi:MazG nucleotide pyrophosphohydrolase domain-containing protein [Microbacterium sp. nov. GSS16]|uniref:MazG nucleotide pyrophosphohydrolase domain-containing protein n=1 Tax=Microbacterium sp. nov. GSS16 TaxID=3019890 RepID=UPI0023065E9D|nr:MazG nucleotide pyrophosphohydrolase domain-containing protein [Microbacterium sp. nov. GSS16]WCD92681.1 MazG nucleotide pyrophosphohydrolase domain-containing protein [Microbacterium sp. nov. GSS16]
MTDPLSEPDGLRAAAETMRQVRERCVWSQRITHRDLVPYLIEEAHELIDAVERDDRAEMREELGDLLWQVLFHAAIAAQNASEPFDIDDVARGLTEKMVRRHPHVFGDAVATTPEEVLVHWNAAKAAEKRERRSVLDGVPAGMPALARAQKVLGRAARVAPAPAPSWVPAACPEPAEGPATSWVPEPVEGPAESWVPEPVEGPVEPWGPEPAEGSVPPWVPEPADGPASEAELGDALLALVAVAREHGWDAERALRERLRLLESEVRAAEPGD